MVTVLQRSLQNAHGLMTILISKGWNHENQNVDHHILHGITNQLDLEVRVNKIVKDKTAQQNIIYHMVL